MANRNQSNAQTITVVAKDGEKPAAKGQRKKGARSKKKLVQLVSEVEDGASQHDTEALNESFEAKSVLQPIECLL